MKSKTLINKMGLLVVVSLMIMLFSLGCGSTDSSTNNAENEPVAEDSSSTSSDTNATAEDQLANTIIEICGCSNEQITRVSSSGGVLFVDFQAVSADEWLQYLEKICQSSIMEQYNGESGGVSSYLHSDTEIIGEVGTFITDDASLSAKMNTNDLDVQTAYDNNKYFQSININE